MSIKWTGIYGSTALSSANNKTQDDYVVGMQDTIYVTGPGYGGYDATVRVHESTGDVVAEFSVSSGGGPASAPPPVRTLDDATTYSYSVVVNRGTIPADDPSGIVISIIGGALKRFPSAMPVPSTTGDSLVSPVPVVNAIDVAGKPGWDDRFANYATLSGTYTGNGSNTTLNLNAEPSLIVVTGGTAAGVRMWAPGCWLGRSFIGDSLANVGDIDVIGRTVTLSGALIVNTTVYSYTVIFDPYQAAIVTANFQGNYLDNTTYDLLKGRDPLAILYKRDNTVPMYIATRNGGWQTDGAATAPITVNADGTYTLTSSSNTNGGEGNQVVGIVRSPHVYAFEYISRGANSVSYDTPFEEIEMIWMLPEGVYGYGAGVWMSGDPGATNLHPFAAGAVQTSSISSVDRGRVTINNAANFNKNAERYLFIAFGKVRTTPAIPYALVRKRLRQTPTIMLGSDAWFDCGTSDTLKIDGQISIEWLGASLQATNTINSAGNTDTNARCMVSRALLGSATPGTVSFGLFAGYNPDTAGLPTYWIANQNFIDFPTSGQSRTSPRQTGVRVEPRKLQHVIVTRDGLGWWRLYLNGEYKKAWQYPAEVIAGGTAHRTLIGAINGASSTDLHNSLMGFGACRIYNRALSYQEVQQNLWACANPGVSGLVAPDFVEEWLASNITGSTLRATNYSANNGTLQGGLYQQKIML